MVLLGSYKVFIIVVSSLTLYVHVIHSEFKDIFDVQHFITSLRDHVRVVKSLPSSLRNIEALRKAPISWSQVHGQLPDESDFLVRCDDPFSINV